jgi:hypothetical protein
MIYGVKVGHSKIFRKNSYPRNKSRKMTVTQIVFARTFQGGGGLISLGEIAYAKAFEEE